MPTTTQDLKPWPRCTVCQQPYTLTLGLPVTIGPSGVWTRYVDVDVDTGEVCWDDSATVSCRCGTLDDQPLTTAEFDAIAERLSPVLVDVAMAKPVLAVLDTTDVRPTVTPSPQDGPRG